MQVGMIGVGRMGANMVRRLMQHGHECVVYARRASSLEPLVQAGATGSTSLEDFASKLTTPRLAWMMIPAASVDPTIANLEPYLEAGDILVDGGNSYYRDDLRRAKLLQPL